MNFIIFSLKIISQAPLSISLNSPCILLNILTFARDNIRQYDEQQDTIREVKTQTALQLQGQ